MFRWRLYYAGKHVGVVFSDTDGRANESPEVGLVCIAQPDAAGEWYTVLTNFDWALYREDRGYWTGHDLTGALAELSEDAPNITAVRAGKYVTTPKFERLWARARADAKAAGTKV